MPVDLLGAEADRSDIATLHARIKAEFARQDESYERHLTADQRRQIEALDAMLMERRARSAFAPSCSRTAA